MEDFTTQTYGTGGPDNRPLFGETSAWKYVLVVLVWILILLMPYNSSGNWILFFAFNYWHVRDWIGRIVDEELNWQPDRIICFVFGGITVLLVLVTVISSFLFPTLPPKPLNIFFAICIIMICVAVIVLIFWYRQGDLEPKFRILIYYILLSVVVLCICANLYFHDVGK